MFFAIMPVRPNFKSTVQCPSSLKAELQIRIQMRSGPKMYPDKDPADLSPNYNFLKLNKRGFSQICVNMRKQIFRFVIFQNFKDMLALRHSPTPNQNVARQISTFTNYRNVTSGSTTSPSTRPPSCRRPTSFVRTDGRDLCRKAFSSLEFW